MGCDMVVALGSATVNGHTFFGTNSHGPVGACQALKRYPGKAYALGENVQTQHLQVPQARQTFSVLGSQPLNTWGFQHGINEHQLAAGCATWHSKMACSEPGLAGTDLVRLTLERSRTARQAFDLVISLVSRYGQGHFAADSSGSQADHVFVLADPAEAYLIETAGASWASVECHEARAASDVGLIRQDWQRIAPGLAEHAITQGWWRDDGSKVDFSASLSRDPAGQESALRRWGRATLLLEQHSGNIDGQLLRCLLSDHYEGSSSEVDPLSPEGPVPLCRHPSRANPTATTASFIAELTADPNHVAMAWCAFGPPCASVYLPIFLEGALPEPLSRPEALPGSLWWRLHLLVNAMSSDAGRWARLRNSLAHLQARFDQEAEEFYAEVSALKQKGENQVLERQASLFMQNHVEQLEAELLRIQTPIVVGVGLVVGE